MLFNRSISMIRVSARWLWPLGISVAIALLFSLRAPILAGAGGAPSSPPQDGPTSLIPSQSRKPAPDLNLTDIAGAKVSLASYRGKVVLLDFWAVDCGGCVKEIPWYVEFDHKYHEKGLQPLGIDMYDEPPSKIKPFMEKAHMQYPVAVGNDEIRNRFQADELPKTMLIDRQGRVAVSHVGIVDKATFERDIEELLK